MIACYDLQQRLPTFDFFYWLTHVRVLGARAITVDHGRKYFMRKKWPEIQTRRRVDSIIMPGPALAGLPCIVGSEGDHEIGSHLVRDLIHDLDGRDIPRLRAPRAADATGPYITVTLRTSIWKPERNSNRDLWLRFARETGALVVEDYELSPVPLHERMAFYAGAEMNYGVANGPLALLFLTDYPVTMFCGEASWRASERQDLLGKQLPWQRANQRHVWAEADIDTLMEAAA